MVIAASIPEWLVSEHYLTLATWGLVLCTFFLVVATFVLWTDSLKKGAEQRERWAREDMAANERRKPRFEFGLKITPRKPQRVAFADYVAEPAAHLWVANLGASGLYVERLSIKHRDLGDGEIEVNEIVREGDQLAFTIPDSFWQKVPGIKGGADGNYLYGDHQVWLTMSDASERFESGRILYNIIFMDRRFVELRRGSWEDRQPTCTSCGRLINAVFPRTGLLTEEDVLEQGWKSVVSNVARTCPHHVSAHLQELSNSRPPWFPNEPSEPNA